MTTVSFLRDARGLCGIRVSGHAGYAPAGEDIVCAAASVLITTCANALESVAGIRPNVSHSERPVMIQVDSSRPVRIGVALPGGLSPASEHDARIILRTAEQGFLDIAAQYPSYLQII